MNKVKRVLCLAIVVIMALGSINITTAAAEKFDVSASVNYDTSVVTINVTTPAKYVQKISIVMYKEGETISLPTDYMRAVDVYSNGTGNASTKIKLTESDGQGYIIISAAGNGSLAQSCKDTCKIYFESGSYIENTTLPLIESATATELESLIYEKADMLGVDITDFNANKSVICNLFANIRQNDFGGKCGDMDTVEKILSGVKLIRDLNDSSNAASKRTICEEKAALISVDTQNSYYKNNETDIYGFVHRILSSSEPKCIKDVNKAINQGIAMANFNKLDATKNTQLVKDYIKWFDVTQTAYDNAVEAYGALEVNKAFAGRNFETPIDVTKAFNDALEALAEKNEAENTDSEITGGFVSGGGGGGFGGGRPSADKDLLNTGNNSDIIGNLPTGGVLGDITKEHWAYVPVMELCKKGVINGVGNGLFEPEAFVTREAFVKMLVLAFDIYDEMAITAFRDLDNHWAKLYVASAQLYGIVGGYDTSIFGVGDKISRQDAAVMLNRLIAKKGITINTENDAKKFSDDDMIAAYAKESVDNLSRMDIINGVTDSEFCPTSPLTRAQAAKIIYGVISR